MTSLTIYNHICQSRKSNKVLYKKGSGLHKHHILPSHSGGLDVSENYTYLTVREHIIAHYLLWRINKNPDDLRSMKMLGANLSVAYRRIIGLWCVENKIGFHNDSITQEQRSEWQEKGRTTQKETGSKDSFYYWSTIEGRTERASMGGKAGSSSQITERGFPAFISLDSEQRIKDARYAGTLSPKKPATDGKSTKKFHTNDERIIFLNNNPEWYIGCHPTGKRSPTGIPSANRKKVTDGIITFPSIREASIKYNKSGSTIINWCKSNKTPNWEYVL